MYPPNPPCIPIVPHTCYISPPISSISVWPPEQNLLWSTKHEAGHYVVFSSAQYFLSAAPQYLPQVPSVCLLFLTWETKFSTHNIYTHILGCLIRRCSSFWEDICTGDRDTKDNLSVCIFVSSRFLHLSNYTNKTHSIYYLHVFILFLLQVSMFLMPSSGRTYVPFA